MSLDFPKQNIPTNPFLPHTTFEMHEFKSGEAFSFFRKPYQKYTSALESGRLQSRELHIGESLGDVSLTASHLVTIAFIPTTRFVRAIAFEELRTEQLFVVPSPVTDKEFVGTTVDALSNPRWWGRRPIRRLPIEARVGGEFEIARQVLKPARFAVLRSVAQIFE
jgi:hypothetical protein